MQKRWRILEPEMTLPAEAFPQLHPIAGRLFANRGMTTVFDAEAFLNPDWDTGIHDPQLFRGMKAAVERTLQAIADEEQITVHGDYDADGVTGSAVVITTLKELGGKNVDSYIPHRDKEGYGLRKETVGILKERGTSLIITVDCGIACVDEIALARSVGIDVIVLDHHQFGDALPDGMLIHPRIPGETYPFPHLAAVGVSWKFACALAAEARSRGMEIPVGFEKWLLDLVSIATVTDMVPVVGENRVLLTYGLKVLNKSRRPGLHALVNASRRTMGELDAEAIGFSIGPRINAAGRMDHASVALDLMLSETTERASAIVLQIEELNKRRQKTVEAMMIEAEEMMGLKKNDSAIVLWNPTWSPSLVGLVAGRYLEQTGKPTAVIGKHGDVWIGSGRSPSSYDITAGVRRAGEGMLTRAGGHVQACGFSFASDDHAEPFAKNLVRDAGERLSVGDLVPILDVDAEVSLDDLDWRLVETVQKFEPFGVGNTRPLFASRNLIVQDVGTVGATASHLRFTLTSPSGRRQKFIAFKIGSRLAEFPIGAHVDVVYDVGTNEWNGRTEIQCKVVDVRAVS